MTLALPQDATARIRVTGQYLDEHHGPVVNGANPAGMPKCEHCGFTVWAGQSRHWPLVPEIPAVLAWVERYASGGSITSLSHRVAVQVDRISVATGLAPVAVMLPDRAAPGTTRLNGMPVIRGGVFGLVYEFGEGSGS